MKKIEKGFTLVELLAIIVVIVIVGMILTSILGSSLRGTVKTKTMERIRQNGNYAISQIAKMIGYAKSFDGISINGTTYFTNCVQTVLPDPTPTPTPASYQYVKITAFDSQQTVFSCAQSTIASNSSSLIDQSTITVSSCSFTCSQLNFSDPPVIDLTLTLSNKTEAGFSENTVSIPFQTSIKMRNLSR